MKEVKVGIIGGSGIKQLIENPKITFYDEEYCFKFPVHSQNVKLPEFYKGVIEGVDVVFMYRHGEKHETPPHLVDYRNIVDGLKQLGCTHIIGLSAVGSLQEAYKPGDLVLPNQFIDRTNGRPQSFYDGITGADGFRKVAHVSVADPVCNRLRELIEETAEAIPEFVLHGYGEIIEVTINGPRFSTKAESQLYRSWDADIIGMTLVPECVLAREAEIPYVRISMVTDYDCWKEESVSTQSVINTMKQNAKNVELLLKKVLPKIKYDADNPIRNAMQGAIFE